MTPPTNRMLASKQLGTGHGLQRLRSRLADNHMLFGSRSQEKIDRFLYIGQR
jgi:hypothetical protein